jgi:hypothetical protein
MLPGEKNMNPSGAHAALTLAVLALTPAVVAAQDAPLPVRHGVAQPGTEFLVLRHQRLVPGSHPRFHELSRDGVWPLYEKIGARVVGQWLVVFPEGGGNSEHDEGYRLARYRSYEHWAATRRTAELAGNGPDWRAGVDAIAARRELLLGSDGAVYLEGAMAPGGPYYMPATGESWVPTSEPLPEAAPLARRHARPAGGREIVTLRHFKIRKGSFEEFYRLSRDGVWPYFEKMGARVLGQWRRVYSVPGDLDRATTAAGSTAESPDWDEAFMMVRYASHEHWRASRPGVMAELGGNGPDWEACMAALARRRELTVETSVRFLEGHLHQSPPAYLPALEESFLVRDPSEPSH